MVFAVHAAGLLTDLLAGGRQGRVFREGIVPLDDDGLGLEEDQLVDPGARRLRSVCSLWCRSDQCFADLRDSELGWQLEEVALGNWD